MPCVKSAPSIFERLIGSTSTQQGCSSQCSPLCRTRYVGNCSSVGHDVRFERVVMVRGVYFDHIDVGPQAFSLSSKVKRSYFALITLNIEI